MFKHFDQVINHQRGWDQSIPIVLKEVQTEKEDMLVLLAIQRQVDGKQVSGDMDSSLVSVSFQICLK